MAATQQVLHQTVRSLNARAWGLSAGLLFGFGLLIATNVLVIKGGPNVGAHLRLLSNYFPGYSVSFVGSLIGFVYAFVVGYGLGRLVATIYVRLIERS